MSFDDDPPVGCIGGFFLALAVALCCWVIVLVIVAWRLGG